MVEPLAENTKLTIEKDRRLLISTVSAIKMLLDIDKVFIDEFTERGAISNLLNFIVSLKQNPDVKLIAPIIDLLGIVVKHE
jgi:hypothetical protein